MNKKNRSGTVDFPPLKMGDTCGRVDGTITVGHFLALFQSTPLVIEARESTTIIRMVHGIVHIAQTRHQKTWKFAEWDLRGFLERFELMGGTKVPSKLDDLLRKEGHIVLTHEQMIQKMGWDGSCPF